VQAWRRPRPDIAGRTGARPASARWLLQKNGQQRLVFEAADGVRVIIEGGHDFHPRRSPVFIEGGHPFSSKWPPQKAASMARAEVDSGV
jgi:hypothetical protein